MAFVPPPYPHDRLGPVRAVGGGGARRHGRRVGRHAGRPDARRRRPRARRRGARCHRLPGHHRQPRAAGGGGGVDRRAGSAAWSPPTRWSRASAPRSWWRRCRGCCSLRDPSRDTVLYPAVAYPTYEMGAAARRAARGAGAGRRRAGTSTSARVDPADADAGARALAQRPRQPHRRHRHARADAATRSSGRGRAASSWPATSATPSSPTTPTACPPRRSPRSTPGSDGVLAVHSLVEALEHGRAARRASSPATGRWSATSVRCASTAGS